MSMTSELNPNSAVVFLYLPEDGYVPAGRISFDPARETCSFGYGRKYLRRPNALPLDPVSLPLSMDNAVRFTEPGENLFSALRDAAPDHWGRKILSLMAGEHMQALNEFELLTAGFTPNKVGALAFGRDPVNGPHSLAAWFDPKGFSRVTADLNLISRIVRKLDDAEDDELGELRNTLPNDEFLRALALSPSVGGARPKCLFQQDGVEYIVKFSRAHDIWDEPVVEHATMTLAAKCGISVAQTRLVPLENGHSLFVRRFDRTGEGHPRHFVSGYTLGDLQETGDWKSYQHLAQEARRFGDPQAGEELFRRMVFNMLCSNIDDHPRNQSFFIHRNRVELTPAYDIVPTSFAADTHHLALRCGIQGGLASLDNALSDVAPFGLPQVRAEQIVEQIVETCRGWTRHFAGYGVGEKDLAELKKRFNLFK